jgi:hypothetical protein
VDTLRWKGLDIEEMLPQHEIIVNQLKKYADACIYIKDRETLFHETRRQRIAIHEIIEKLFKESPEFAKHFGLDANLGFEVHGLRRSVRVSPGRQHVPQVVVFLTQSRQIEIKESPTTHTFRGGSTLVVDLTRPAIQYAIIKRIDSQTRQERTEAFLSDAMRDPFRALLFAPNRKEPFAALHALV